MVFEIGIFFIFIFYLLYYNFEDSFQTLKASEKLVALKHVIWEAVKFTSVVFAYKSGNSIVGPLYYMLVSIIDRIIGLQHGMGERANNLIKVHWIDAI